MDSSEPNPDCNAFGARQSSSGGLSSHDLARLQRIAAKSAFEGNHFEDEETPAHQVSPGRRASMARAADGQGRTPFSYRRYSQAVTTNRGMGVSPEEAIELYARRSSQHRKQSVAKTNTAKKDLQRREQEEIQMRRRQSYDFAGNIIRKTPPSFSKTSLDRRISQSSDSDESRSGSRPLSQNIDDAMKPSENKVIANTVEENNNEPWDPYPYLEVKAVDPEEFQKSLELKTSTEVLLFHHIPDLDPKSKVSVKVISGDDLEQLRSRIPEVSNEDENKEMEDFVKFPEGGLMGGLPEEEIEENSNANTNGRDKHYEELTDHLENYIIDPTEYYEEEEEDEEKNGEVIEEVIEEEEEEEEDAEFLQTFAED